MTPSDTDSANDSSTVGAAPQVPSPVLIRLGNWNFYFLLKLVLYWRELIDFHPLENLAFAAFLLAPLASPRWLRARLLLAPPIAVALLYYDSWLPPLARAISQANLLANFSLVYLGELLGRFINWHVIALLVITWAVYRLLARRVRIGVLVIGVLVVLSWNSHSVRVSAPSGTPTAANVLAGPDKLDDELRQFYVKEGKRSVSFNKQTDSDAPFDVLFIHVCSLSWDDLRAMGMDSHPLWQRFDFLMTQFNSAASYSGPAAIRIQRATCGQASHQGLYAPVADNCYLMSSLKQAGFEPSLVLNHDGHFDDFLSVIQSQGGMKIPPMPLAGLPIPQRSFDDSPIYDDLAVLDRWLDNRQKSGAQRVAAYYNTVSLHDGNRLTSDSKRSSMDSYKLRLGKLLDNLEGFMRKLEQSGRRAVVVLIPEHGAAIRGDRMQIAGLREIPTPAITHVPVGIKVIGPGVMRSGDSYKISQPSSFLAVSQIVARMLEKSPFSTAGFVPSDYAADLPVTDFVAENEGGVMMRQGGKYYLRQDKDGWKEYAGEASVEGAKP